jgi:hypothetical protein
MAIRPFRFLRDMLDLDETGKTAGKVVAVNDSEDGYELVDAAAASGGAPTTATYIVQTSDATLSAEQALADLATGIVKNTTTTGVLSIAAEGTDYYGPSGTDVALADGGTGASLSDPGADRIMFWDDSGTTVGFLQTGSGLSLSGTVLTASGSLPAAGNGLTLTGTVLDVVVDDSTLEINTDTLRVKDGGITAAKVAADVATQAELDAHINDTSAAHAASAISADSTTLVGTGTDVQAVLEDLDNGIADHLADTTDAHDASAISVLDTAANFTGTDVEAVLAELQDNIDNASGTGAPTDATYIVQTANGSLSAEQALSSLSTGMLKVTTATGVLSTGTEGTDYYKPTGTDVTLADGGTGASLSDPGADRIMFWDDSAGSTAYLEAGSGLSISGTVLTSSGGGSTTRYLNLTPSSAVLPDGSSGNSAPALTRIQGTETNPKKHLLALGFDGAGGTEYAWWTFVLPADYSSGGSLDLLWVLNDTSNAVKWQAKVSAVTPGDADTPIEHAAASAATVTTNVNTTEANRLTKSTITLTMDSAAGGDLISLTVFRDSADAADTATADAQLVGAVFSYTIS